jgi:ATP-dependent exoDNAse (exonuclease V) beta subunit
MSDSIFARDTDISFPHFAILKASAGSGKTHALTKRFVQFILSDRIPWNHLRNILAITFSNNAAKQMRERTLAWLKDVYFKDREKLAEMGHILSLKEGELSQRAETRIDDIFSNYTDFQVKTIDSFMTSLFRASAIDLGYSPEFEVVLAPETVMTFAFNRFLRKVKQRSEEATLLEELLDLILEGKGAEHRYPWDPSKELLEEMMELYQKLTGTLREIELPKKAEDLASVKADIAIRAKELDKLIEKSGLQRSRQSTFSSILEAITRDTFADLIGRGLKNVPVIKPKKAAENASYQQITDHWGQLGEAIRNYVELYAFRYYWPYVKTYEALKDLIEHVKREEGVVFLNDMGRKLTHYLDLSMVPDVYFRIGETIYHYLIDEFQDTSPIQWRSLFPLIENSLSQGGSCFVVGDTKQAVYGFRNADYRIMRGLESENPFPSARHEVKELTINYRSREKIVQFNETFFKEIVAQHEVYGKTAGQSGLTDYQQEVRKEYQGSGVVEVIRCEEDEEELPEKRKLQDLVKELRKRGYRCSDLAILTFRNEHVVDVTTWLDEIEIPFVSYSNLDVRTRKLTEEILFLLTFLDSPLEDLSFAGFLVGDLFRRALARRDPSFTLRRLHEFLFRNRKQAPLYGAFRKNFPALWDDYFDGLFRGTGYLPLYDLVSEVYRVFDVFETFPEEEATLVKILEVIKNFESQGMNNPTDFLRRASEQETTESDWNIDVPEGIEAVQVMTIHKAKGLGFPVVIVLLYEETGRGFKYVLDEGPHGVFLLKVTQKIAEASSLLTDLYETERKKSLVNRLNTLYVAFTRAEGELYLLGVSSKKKQFPLDVMENIESGAGTKDGPVCFSKKSERVTFFPTHSNQPAEFFARSEREDLNIEERRRGEFFHQILSSIEFLTDDIEPRLEEAVCQANHARGTDYPVGNAKKILLEFVMGEEILPYFVPRPGRWVKREQEYVDPQGRLLRMDRVIIDEDQLTVMDYKTGSERKAEASHMSQLRSYMSVLKGLYPDKDICGLIAYVDLKETRKVD